MTTERRAVSLEGAKSSLRALAARALAQALIDGIDHAEQEGHKLTLLQQTDMATMAVMAYEDQIAQAEGLLEVEAAIYERKGAR